VQGEEGYDETKAMRRKRQRLGIAHNADRAGYKARAGIHRHDRADARGQIRLRIYRFRKARRGADREAQAKRAVDAAEPRGKVFADARDEHILERTRGARAVGADTGGVKRCGGIHLGGMARTRAGRKAMPANRALSALADLIWPPRSLLSERIVSRPGTIEPELWGRLQFLSAPCCVRCGFPFETDAGPDAYCGACAAAAPDYDRARAALAYDDLSRKLVLDIKRGARRDGLKAYAAWMRLAGGALVEEADVLAPAPLHWSRLFGRRFNQAAWLAQALGALGGKPVDLFALKRVKRRKSQAGLDAGQRRRNVAGVFAVSKAGAARVKGKAVLLVDDVFTTGATAEACAKALKRAGASRVDVVTLARVVRPVDVLI
jgi:ComF family protein